MNGNPRQSPFLFDLRQERVSIARLLQTFCNIAETNRVIWDGIREIRWKVESRTTFTPPHAKGVKASHRRCDDVTSVL